jgi:outer membrane receptor protein involved in Fe transport
MFNSKASSAIHIAARMAFIFGSVLCRSFDAQAASQDDVSSGVIPDAEFVLPRVEVVARPLKNSFISVTDPKTPRQPLPASDGADYLKTLPGFTAIRSGGINGDPVLRGMFGSRLNLLANGAPTQGACPARMDSPSSYVAPESYDKVTVIKGPQTVLYGPGASAGTVLFEREAPRFDTAGAHVDASVMGGSNGRNDENLELTAGNPDVYARARTRTNRTRRIIVTATVNRCLPPGINGIPISHSARRPMRIHASNSTRGRETVTRVTPAAAWMACVSSVTALHCDSRNSILVA